MYRSIFRPSRILRAGRRRIAVAVTGCMVLSGCANLDFRGEEFQYDPTFELGSQSRGDDNRTTPVAVTNKSMQIERNLGVR